MLYDWRNSTRSGGFADDCWCVSVWHNLSIKLSIVDKELRRVNRDITDLKKIKQLAGKVKGKEQ